MSEKPTLVFIPGAWHRPQCYEKVIKLLEDEQGFRCVAVALPSTSVNPRATFKDDVDAARDAIVSELTQGLDVIVVAHSYGGMVGNSCIKGLTSHAGASASTGNHVLALVLIASGFTPTGLAFIDVLGGQPPPFWRANTETGFAEITSDERDLFYHDLDREEGEYWVGQMTTQSLKAFFEGGEHAYAGWKDVPAWYIGTVEDKGLPVAMQRMQVDAVREEGAVVHHTELPSGHSPFLSMPREVVAIIGQAAQEVTGSKAL